MKQDLLWEAAMTAIYGDTAPKLTQSERKKTGKLLNELRELQVTPDELTARARQYPKVMPKDCILTLAALVNNWSRLTPKKAVRTVIEPYVAPIGKATPEGIKAALELLPANLRKRFDKTQDSESPDPQEAAL